MVSNDVKMRMVNLFLKSYYLLLFTAILFVMVGCSAEGIIIDIHFNDTYFVISAAYIYWSIAAMLGCIWLLYLLTHSVMFSDKLVKVHITGTIVICVCIATGFLL